MNIHNGSHSKGFFPSWTKGFYFFELVFFWKPSTSRVSQKRYLTFMNWFNVNTFQCTFFTNVAMKWFHSFMNWCNVQFQLGILCKKGPQVLHWKGFFLSWTDEMCLSNLLFTANQESQIVHWYGFLVKCIRANFTFLSRSEKLYQAETHFLSHFG